VAETHRCDAVVVATGASASELLRPLGARLPVVGATGYSVTVRGGGTAPSRAVYLCEPKIGLSPFGDELRIAGIFDQGAARVHLARPECRTQPPRRR